MQFNRLEFNEFPRTWGVITIPENFVVYRGGTSPPLLKSDPRFFSDFNTADMYTRMQPNYKTYACCTNELKLMDIRTLKYLFLEYVGYNRLMFTDDELGLIKKIKFALGLIPIKNQLDYIQTYADVHTGLYHWKTKYPNPGNLSDVEYDIRCNYEEKIGNGPMHMNFEENIEYYMSYGNRISEGSIDDYMVGLLKIIFKDVIDGYIAPRLETVWHDFNFHSELCLFDPSKSLKLCTEVPSGVTDPDSYIPPINIGALLGTRVIADFDFMLGGGKEDGEERSKCARKDKFEQLKTLPQNFANENDTKTIQEEIKKHWKIEQVEEDLSDKTVPFKENFYEVFGNTSKTQVSKINTDNINTGKPNVEKTTNTRTNSKIIKTNTGTNSKKENSIKTETRGIYDPELF